MLRISRILVALTLVISLALGAPSTLVKPTSDSFYDPPSGFEDKAEGTVLKWRTTPQPIGPLIRPLNTAGSWQALVRSSDSFGNPTAIVTTIIKPYNADPKKVLSYQSMEDSSAENCAPSYSFQFMSDPETLALQAEIYILQVALDRGYYVVTPDYEGPKAAFTAGRQAGHAVLDSLRATISTINETGIDPDAKYALYGYSGGSLASGWAASLQPTYAQDLTPKLIGATIGGFVTNISETVVASEGQIYAGLIPNGLWGLGQEYPEFLQFMKDELSEFHFNLLKRAGDTCLLGSFVKFFGHRFFSGLDPYFPQRWATFQVPLVANMLNSNTLLLEQNAEIPNIPLMIYHATNDEIVPYHGNSDRYYDNLCKWKPDISLELNVDLTGGHVLELAQGAPAAFAWLERLFAGKDIVQGCHKTTRINNLLYPGSDKSIYSFILAGIKSIFGNDIGPNGENIDLDLKLAPPSYYNQTTTI